MYKNFWVEPPPNDKTPTNINYISKWYTPVEYADLVEDLYPGDCIQFDEHDYWVLYVGYWPYEGKERPCIVHKYGYREKDDDDGAGIVLRTPLKEVFTSKARINNSYDFTMPPFHPVEIVERAIAYVGKDNGYCLYNNHCENFVHILRNRMCTSQIGNSDFSSAEYFFSKPEYNNDLITWLENLE